MDFGIVGGDSRYTELANLLERDGHTVRACRMAGAGIAGAVSEEPDTLEAALCAETVILPLPLCREAGYLNCAGKPLAMPIVLDLLSRSPEPLAEPSDETALSGGTEPSGKAEPSAEERGGKTGRLVLAGMVPETVAQEAERRGIRLVDYFRLESLTVANAAATADAALCLTVQRSREALAGKRCLVLGFGRIGKLLCLRLRGAGACVAAAARKSADRAWIRAFGCEAIDLHSLDFHALSALSGGLDRFDVVYNTVPAPVLDRRLLEELAGGRCVHAEKAKHTSDGTPYPVARRDAPLLVELASRPGFDQNTAERLGLRVLPANGLPGKIVPVTAAAVLRDAVYEILTAESASRGKSAVFESGGEQGGR